MAASAAKQILFAQKAKIPLFIFGNAPTASLRRPFRATPLRAAPLRAAPLLAAPLLAAHLLAAHLIVITDTEFFSAADAVQLIPESPVAGGIKIQAGYGIAAVDTVAVRVHDRLQPLAKSKHIAVIYDMLPFMAHYQSPHLPSFPRLGYTAFVY